MTRLVRARRTARVWALTARNGLRYGRYRIRRAITGRDSRAELDDQFAIRAAEDVAHHLGNMKGAMMKFGQLVGFILEALPDDAQRALASLQSDAPPMSPSAAERVVVAELGVTPLRAFADWGVHPIAAASVGQVHRAVTRDGRDVAVKVQYPGIDAAIDADLNNTELLYRMVGTFALKGLDYKGLVDELRARMIEELDYRREAANQLEFVEYFAGHPFIRIPTVDVAMSRQRVLTTEWVDGISFAEFMATASVAAKQRAGEIIWRFAQHAVHLHGAFNGDPHPGNYRFDLDGNVTFLDFGLVKRWSGTEWQRLLPTLDAIVIERDAAQLMTAMEAAGFLQPDHGLSADDVYGYVGTPYIPYLSERFQFTRSFLKDTLGTIMDVRGPHAHVISKLNMPPSFVILDRVVWGVSAILGKLEAEGPWRAMVMEYRRGDPPATELGQQERAWLAARP